MGYRYTKLFEQILESTVWCEPDSTRVVWITMLAMSDKSGEVLASVPGLAKRAMVPVEDVRSALTCFLSPDPDSRTKDYEGRRIAEIDGGWQLLNHEKYRDLLDSEAEKERKRKWWEQHRGKGSKLDAPSGNSQNLDGLAQAPTPASTTTSKSKALSRSPTANGDDAVEVLNFLNLKTGKQFRMVDTNLKLIRDRLKSGATVQDCKTLIARKCNDWARKPEMQAYLRPATLFNLTKFEQYIGEIEQEKSCNAPVATRESSPDRNHAPVGGARQTQTSEKPPQTQTVKDALALALGADANGPEFLPAK